MNFFEHQDVARKKTGQLVVLFVVAVVAIVIALHLTAVFALAMLAPESASGEGRRPGGVTLLDPFAAVLAVGTAALIIGGGTLFKLAQLRAGGKVIAEHLGGKLLTHNTADATGQRVLNVVEEMAIAAGTPVPPVYYMANEPGINAFAAGYRLEDAVIGVTRGTAERLTRDQLQGVIAHEFSHIVSGDMRINLRLVGILHGILLLGMTGGIILRSLYYTGGAYRSRSSSSDNKGNAVIVILAIGAALAAIGYIGTFFGNWIKAAVSRQREYLADASAVQFTRNPDGIAGALKAIGGHQRGAKLVSPNAAEASHMFFGQALSSVFATHPPLKERIRRIEPNWDGSFITTKPSAAELAELDKKRRRVRKALHGDERGRGFSPASAGGAAVGFAAGDDDAGPIPLADPISPAAAIATAGAVTASGVEAARAILSGLPESLVEAAHDPFSSRAVILALLLDRDAEVRGRQHQAVASADAVLAREVGALEGAVRGIGAEARLPVLEIAMQPLSSLSPRQAERFRALLESFIRADERVSLFEWTLHRMVSRRLDAAVGRVARSPVRYYAVGRLGQPLGALLSAIARAGAADEAAAERAFGAGAGVLRGVAVEFQPRQHAGLRDLAHAVQALSETAPKVKRQVLEAAAAVIAHDREVTAAEAELFRAVAESLEVPLPPMYATP